MSARQSILDDILESVTAEEWLALEDGSRLLVVSDFNRATLLRLRELDPPDGEVDDERVALLQSRLVAYLREQLPDKPDAHRFIVSSCIGLAFVLCEPLHPIESTGIRFRVNDGAATYYCPARENQRGSLCEFCVCRDMGEWESHAQRMAAACASRHGEASAHIARAAFDAGLLETGVIPTSELAFHESVRKICEENSCGAYGKTWACPPAIGDLASCRERCLGFEHMQLVSCAYLLDDEFDFENVSRHMADFDGKIDTLAEAVRRSVPNALVLSNEGCSRCAQCTWPDAPCRFPEKLHPSIEGFGFVVSELAEKAGIRYYNGPRTVTFFGGVLY